MSDTRPTPTTGKEIIVTGIAEHSKSGAVVVADSITWHIKDKPDWDKEGYLKKKIRVAGYPEKREHKEELKNERGEYKGGLEGTVHYLRMLWCEPAD